MPRKTPQTSFTCQSNGRRPVRRPRTRWTDYIEDLGWNGLALYTSGMIDVIEDREMWRLNLELLPPQPSRKSGQWRKKKTTMHAHCTNLIPQRRILKTIGVNYLLFAKLQIATWPPVFPVSIAVRCCHKLMLFRLAMRVPVLLVIQLGVTQPTVKQTLKWNLK